MRPHILIDSDKTSASAEINETKKRIAAEISNIGGMAWITEGREIENYLPAEALQKLYPDGTIGAVGQYEAFSEHLERAVPGAGKRFLTQKVVFAARICPHITVESIKGTSDLAAKLSELCMRIRSWNRLTESAPATTP
jgi:putative ATP-dependent endonuclease of the OLD family